MIWYLFIIGLLVLLITPLFAYRQAKEFNEELSERLKALEQRYTEFIAHRIRQEKLRALGLSIDAQALQEAAQRFLQAEIAKFLSKVRKRPYAGLNFSEEAAIFARFAQRLEKACQVAQRQRIQFPEADLQEALQEDIEHDLLQRLLNTSS